MPSRTCRACASQHLETFLDLGRMPLAGGFLAGQQEIAGEQRYPLPIYVCTTCSLVQIVDAVDPDILFQNYSFASSTVGPLVDHFRAYARWLNDNFKPRTAVEFGCNDGILLGPLKELGIAAYGVDVSENISAMAREKGHTVFTGFFNKAMAERIRAEFGQVDIVTGSNAFAHNEHPEAILEAVASILKPDGRLCLEVMYAGDLIEMMQWDTLYHEHLTFYSLGTLTKLLGRHGFAPVHASRIPMHGGSLRLVAQRGATARPDASVAELEKAEQSAKLNAASTWFDFGKRVGHKIDVVRDTFGRLAKSSRVWGYGAAGKATLWVNACGMDYLEAMVDASPLRAGKLMPGTHTPIVFPDELRKCPPDYIFVTAWNYANVIKSKETWYQGIWSTPLPDLRFF